MQKGNAMNGNPGANHQRLSSPHTRTPVLAHATADGIGSSNGSAQHANNKAYTGSPKYIHAHPSNPVHPHRTSPYASYALHNQLPLSTHHSAPLPPSSQHPQQQHTYMTGNYNPSLGMLPPSTLTHPSPVPVRITAPPGSNKSVLSVPQLFSSASNKTATTDSTGYNTTPEIDHSNASTIRSNVAANETTASSPSTLPEISIREVWADNLEEELALMRDVVDSYPFIAMDTEFPGIVARPIGSFKNSSDYHYQTLRCNCDLLRIIQLGLTVCNQDGEVPTNFGCWQFNFKFSLSEDMYAPDSIDLLTKSGIDFKKQESYGIDPTVFAELLITSGFVLSQDVRWISFHSGYDFGYLIKVLSCAALPLTEPEFFENLKIWFPGIYDIKYLMKSCKSLKGGLQDVADSLQVSRIGPQHQAGSDSLLTAMTFFKMREQFFENEVDDVRYLNHLFGLGQASSNHGHSGFSIGAPSNMNSGVAGNMTPVSHPMQPYNMYSSPSHQFPRANSGSTAWQDR